MGVGVLRRFEFAADGLKLRKEAGAFAIGEVESFARGVGKEGGRGEGGGKRSAFEEGWMDEQRLADALVELAVILRPKELPGPNAEDGAGLIVVGAQTILERATAEVLLEDDGVKAEDSRPIAERRQLLEVDISQVRVLRGQTEERGVVGNRTKVLGHKAFLSAIEYYIQRARVPGKY